MSDQQQGLGWWLASDGKWYPPDQAPPVPPPQMWGPPPGPAPKRGMSTGGIVALVIAGVVGVLVLLGVGITVLGNEAESSFSQVGTAIDPGSDTTDEGADTTVGEPTEVPDGFEVLEGDGVSIAAPAEWTLLDAEDMAMSGEELAEVFPDAPAAMVEQGLDMFAQGAVLVAFDFGGGEFASNINVIDIPGEAPLGVVEDQGVQQVATLGGEIVDSGIIDVALGEALRIEYTLDVALPDGSSLPAEGVQYYLPIDGRTYIITVSSGADAAGLADVMIDTFQVD